MVGIAMICLVSSMDNSESICSGRAKEYLQAGSIELCLHEMKWH
jgi:hypothetical protein